MMHRRSRLERGLAVMLMTLFSYPHFCVEHVRGHHANVGTRRDPATARLGESLYAFLPRTVLGGFASACRIDPARVFVYLLLVATAYATVAVRFGVRGVAFFGLQSAVAVLLIEILNYVEHYGLVRGERERVSARHSWDSAHRVSNWMMFNVARHADHHRDASRGYAQLRNAAGGRRLPAGYFAMFVLALFPPLWRRVMDPLATMGGDDAVEPVVL
jgi:alkane 1-monooxygenase